MLEKLKKEVCEANLLLVKYGLVTFTWGNASGIDRERGLIVIKPSGVPFDELVPENMAVVDLAGNVIGSGCKPSSDTPTHIELYKAFPDIGGVVHTHSKFATAYAQAGMPVTPYGTTHADFASGEIPCTPELKKQEVESEYELNTGRVIARYFEKHKLDSADIPAVLVRSHGPFAWGKDAVAAADAAAVLETVAEMAYYTAQIASFGGAFAIPGYLLKKHYERKHGDKAYYGQSKT